MNYPFECKCGHKEIISMSIKEYHADNHICPNCKKRNDKRNKITCLWL